MALARGARLGPYEISGLLGAGGMGEVYRARDTRLGRTVALKVLPAEFASEPTRRARFEREARAISALEHPHICTLHDVGEQDGRAYLVMEHLEGETLAERLRKGPLPLAQALEVAAQIADALAAAHKHGIVHRDLKPGNVMLTKAGVKLLDFGLARLTGHGERPSSVPTESDPLTEQGKILGTLPYMAPEQLEGKPLDARTDLWALGVILYEMVTGQRAFEGPSQVSLMGAILEREPAPLAKLQPLAPPSLERLVKRCLAKSPEDRWDTAHDVADELRWIVQGGFAPAGAPTARPHRLWSLLVAVGLAAAVVSGVSVYLVDRRLPTTPRAAVVRSLLDVSPAEELNAGGTNPGSLSTPGGSRTALAWTPNGRSLVFVGRHGGVQQLYVHDLDGDQAHPVEGSEGAQVPVVSPDGQSVAFWANGAIRRVPLLGGPAAVLVKDVPVVPTGLAWRGDGRLFFDRLNAGVIWSAEAERTPTAVTRRLEGEVSHALPHLLPGGHALLYTVRRRIWTWGDEDVVAHVFATGERKTLLRDAADARYVPPGLLVFLRRGVLHAVGFDPAHLEVRGTPEPVLGAVVQALTGRYSRDVTGAGQFSTAPTGALAFLQGDVVPYPDTQVVAIDREGRVSPLEAPVRSYGPISLSPDGRRMAFVIGSLTESTVWLYERERGTLTPLPGGGESDWPRWTPDGGRVAFNWLDKGVEHLAWQQVDGTAAPEILARDANWLSSWSPDGRQLSFVKDDGDIWIATLDGGKAALARLATTPEFERWPEFSPDGRWLALGSNASGRWEIYVQPYPGPGPRQLVSLGGGMSPAWNPAGGELFFLSLPDSEGKRHMMVVDVRPGRTLSIGRPRPLFAFSQPRLRIDCVPVRCFAVAPDGQRFYGLQLMPAPPAAPVTHIHLIQNWTEKLKARVPAEPTR